ncbi:MAG TPA: ATP-binding protein, partial [Rhizomicrobium sp.]|nr:ATP-binding protein [Rhizomicrobium sp.]
ALEAELAADRVQFDLAERAARFGYWRVRLADGHTVWSPGMYRILHVDPKEKADTAWLLAQIIDEDVVNLNQIIAGAIKTRSSFYYRTRTKDPNHPTQCVDTHGDVEVGPDGRVISVIGVCHDVSAEVRAEEARAKAEAMHRLMTEEASDVIMLYGDNARILFASSALQNILGRTVGEIENGRFLELVHPDDLPQAHHLREQLKPGENRTVAYRLKHRDGHYVWMESTVRGVFDEGAASPRNIISVSRDVSERKRQEFAMRAAREEAEAASRAKSGFLASMSHELRTPLNAIIGFADIMRDEMFGALGSPRYAEYVTLIRDSGHHLLELISDILDTAKIEAGKLDLHFERVDLGAVMEDCARLLSQRARDGGIQMIMEAPEGGLPLMADRRAVKQIVLNLLSNALKFTARGGHVWLNGAAAGDHVVLSVRDDGVGIPADALPRLGRAFEQAAADPMLAKSGTGLGLALVRALSESHGGAMQIESVEGEGTTVTVRLAVNPAAKAQAA